MQEAVRSRAWLKAPASVLMVCAFAFTGMKAAAGGLVIVWGAVLVATLVFDDMSWTEGH